MKLLAEVSIKAIHLRDGLHYFFALSKWLIIECTWLEETHEVTINGFGMIIIIIGFVECSMQIGQ
jgi:hypothetical protein